MQICQTFSSSSRLRQVTHQIMSQKQNLKCHKSKKKCKNKTFVSFAILGLPNSFDRLPTNVHRNQQTTESSISSPFCVSQPQPAEGRGEEEEKAQATAHMHSALESGGGGKIEPARRGRKAENVQRHYYISFHRTATRTRALYDWQHVPVSLSLTCTHHSRRFPLTKPELIAIWRRPRRRMGRRRNPINSTFFSIPLSLFPSHFKPRRPPFFHLILPSPLHRISDGEFIATDDPRERKNIHLGIAFLLAFAFTSRSSITFWRTVRRTARRFCSRLCWGTAKIVPRLAFFFALTFKIYRI